ncbi:hypothetical protein J2W36_005317 [Variovorax ginsengisoli]|uniref:Uncharacterized protein n=1 Tax=Variovorax ginsengisoli TaxID=363844 RepID=A0ABT9SF98_9BURK|nr:hypothetical protein [Variovorax ginsengisoli]
MSILSPAAGDCAHAKQFEREKKLLRRQRTVQRELSELPAASSPAVDRLHKLMGRAERIRSQRPKNKNKLYALHAHKVDCIGKVWTGSPMNSA